MADAQSAILAALAAAGVTADAPTLAVRYPTIFPAVIAAYTAARAALQAGGVPRAVPPPPAPCATGPLAPQRIRLAVSGKMGTGKSTLVRALGLSAAPIAAEIKDEAATILGANDYPWLTGAHVAAYKDVFRSFIQWFPALKRALLGGGIYAAGVVARTRDWPNVGCDDVRTRGDVEPLLAAGFLLIRLESPLPVRLARLQPLYPHLTAAQLAHPSECDLDDYPFPFVFDTAAPLDAVAGRVVTALAPWCTTPRA